MKYILKLLIYCFYFLILGCTSPIKQQELTGKKVEIIYKNGRYQFYKNGSPFYVKGASGTTNLRLLKQIGGNTIRTYTTENARELLDSAQSLGLSVILGVWIEPYTKKLHIDDKDFKARTLKFIEHEVNKYKNHPALLAWGIGNEVHPIEPNISSWKLLAEACLIAQDNDPNHPVTTCIAGYPRRNMPLIKIFLENIDFMSFNSFGGLSSFHKKKSNLIYGSSFPYIFSEWGANGYWEKLEKTDWNSPFEVSHSEKAIKISNSWKKFILKDTFNCLGSCIFFWGQKQEFTHSWYSLFSKKNEKTPIVDSLAKLWGGKIMNYSPQFTKLEWTGYDKYNIRVLPNSNNSVNLNSIDTEMDSLSYSFEIRHESSRNIDDFGIEHETNKVPTTFELRNDSLHFVAPEEAGVYRLFIKVSDNKGGCDLANFPFLVID